MMLVGKFDGLTGEQEVREASAEEVAAREAEVAQWLFDKAAREEAQAQARAIKVSAYQKLGLTEAEIEALLPSPKPPLE